MQQTVTRETSTRALLQLTFVPSELVPAGGTFAMWGTDDIVAAASELDLPTGDPGLLRTVALDGAPRPVDLPARLVPVLPVLRRLAAMPTAEDWPAWRRPADSVLAWSTAAKLALETVVGGHLLPSFRPAATPGHGTAYWRAVPPRDGRLAALAEAFPVAAHALRLPDDDQAIHDGHVLLVAFLDAVADVCARQGRRPDLDPRRRGPRRPWAEMWGAALTSSDPTVAHLRLSAEDVTEQVEDWAGPLLGRDTRASARLAMRLVPPAVGDGGTDAIEARLAAADGAWSLELLLQAVADTSQTVPAQDVWDRPAGTLELAGRRVDDAQEVLVRGLAEAARLYPPLDRALSEARPVAVDLSAGDVAALLREGSEALTAAGFGVLVPPELREAETKRLRARIRIGATTGVDGRVTDASTFDMSRLTDFSYEIALGDETLSADEFAEIVALKQPLVRWRGQWVRIDHDEADRLAELDGTTGTVAITEALAAALSGQREVDDLGWVETVSSGDVAELIERLRGTERPHEAEIVGIDGELRDYQRRGVAWLQALTGLGMGGVLADEMGLGKAQPLDARILTPSGWTTMGELSVGDEVIGSDGHPTRVTGVFDQGEKDIYRVVFSDGSSTECCDEHLWLVNTPLRRWRGQAGRVVPLSELRERLIDGAGNRQHVIPMVAPVAYDERDLPLDPYLLGVLLGDGSLRHRAMFSTADPEIVAEVRARLPDGLRVVHASAYDYRISSDGAGRPNAVLDALRELSLFGLSSHEKHVPDLYLRGSVEQRVALLQGVLDTDGHVRPVDDNVEFVTTSRALAEGVQELVHSLGGTAPIREKPTSHRPAFRMSVALPEGIAPFKLSRKAAVYHPRTKYPPSRSIAEVQHVGVAAARCIRVEAADSLYVTDDHILTHNTLQAIALLTSRPDDRPSLVVCPTSVVGNWEREIQRFAPGVSVIRHHGPERPNYRAAFAPGHVAITSYALLRRDVDLLEDIDWDVVIFDEAQQIKNTASKGAKAARALEARSRIAMTGTPIENRLSELWAIIDVTNPGLLGSQRAFNERFAAPIERWRDEEAAGRLRRLVAPFLMRRLKADPDVAVDLPPKNEITVHCSLTREQASLYQAAVDQAFAGGLGTTTFERRGRILALLTALKQICNHPAQYLRDGGRLRGRSGKLTRTTEILGEIVASGDRSIVFTQYREMGELLAQHLVAELDLPDVPFLHGGVTLPNRDLMVQRFQEDEEASPIIIVSLRAGGTGLNLTRATEVIHFDRWWNPAVEAQATDRAHRIGQTRAVNVHTLVTSGTVEDRIAELLERKKALADSVVGSGEGWITELDDQDLRALVALSEDDVEDEDELV